MGKRKEVDSDLEVIDFKKAKFDETISGSTNGYVQHGIGENIDVWLVRKPKSLSLTEVSNMSFPKKIKPSTCEREVNTSEGPMQINFEKTSKSMFYFQAPKRRSEKNPKINATCALKGLAFIKMTNTFEDPFPEAVEEDFDMMDVKIEEEESEKPLPFKLKSIRKTPACGLNVKERLKAFGTVDTDIGSRKKNKHR